MVSTFVCVFYPFIVSTSRPAILAPEYPSRPATTNRFHEHHRHAHAHELRGRGQRVPQRQGLGRLGRRRDVQRRVRRLARLRGADNYNMSELCDVTADTIRFSGVKHEPSSKTTKEQDRLDTDTADGRCFSINNRDTVATAYEGEYFA